mgnify:FL=1
MNRSRMDRDLVEDFADAVTHGSIKRVKQLLKLIPDLNHPDLFRGDSPLYRALTNGHMKIAELLVAHGADPNYRPRRWPLLECKFHQQDKRDIVVFLFKHGATIDKDRIPLVHLSKYIHEYIERPWSPVNHMSWPLPLRKQTLAILCSLRRKRIPAGAVILYLIRDIVVSYFH